MTDLQEDLKHLPLKEYNDDNGGVSYMSDMNNWVCVHLTGYEPEPNSNGDLSIKTTAVATDYDKPRATIHVTLNQPVGNHAYGNWDKASIVILAPYNDVVAKNGNPQEVATEDTYFIPDPDTGLVLPESTYIIRPDPTGEKLIEFGEHGAAYKTDNYTDEEAEQILKLNDWDRSIYEKYLSGDIPDYEVDRFLGYNEDLKKIYEKTKDKKAFMRGILEEDRFLILNKLLRNYAIKKALNEMGYHYVFSHEDYTSGKVAEVARAAGISGDSGNKGHSNSLEHEMDYAGLGLRSLVEAVEKQNIDDIFQNLGGKRNPIGNQIISSILSDSPLPDLYRIFEKAAAQYGTESIEEYNPRLSKVLHRFTDTMTARLNKGLTALKANPQEYKLLETMLKDYVETNENNPGKEWLESTRHSLSYIEQSKERIAELRKRIEEKSAPHLENEKSFYESSVARDRVKIEDDYRDVNPQLASLRAEERRKVKEGVDPKIAQKQRRAAVKEFYKSQKQKEV